MPESRYLATLARGAVVAPAGHGKTEVIAKTAALGTRTLVLTHTHAGVHAIRARLRRLGVSHSSVAVDTIAGWAMRYANAFPAASHPPDEMPSSPAEWDQLYRGARLALNISAIREVVTASYDRVLIDEYQDCNAGQHELAIALSVLVPTIVFGDPMQGIFEFSAPSLLWDREVHPHFPEELSLREPHRWADKNPDLGHWISETRGRLQRGERIDLADERITYRPASDAFDLAAFFDGIDAREGSVAAIHCNRRICNQLAKNSGGAYQSIEEIAASRLVAFAVAWDGARNGQVRVEAVEALLRDCAYRRDKDDDVVESEDDIRVTQEIARATAGVAAVSDLEAARELFTLARQHSRGRVYRGELWRDAGRALGELAAGRSSTLVEAAIAVRQRVSVSGRAPQRRTISTPLLLKGLEFDHVIVPDASHFARERHAQAKLFYVAISRATRTLTITSPDRYIQFQRPTL